MKPAPFEYVAATTVAEATDALRSSAEARVLAGGQSLVPMMNLRLVRPAVLVDVNRITELDVVESDGGTVRLGSLCRHRRLELDPEVRSGAPLLAEAAACIGHPQIRNRGTLGGSLAHADPAAELAAAVVALGGIVRATDGITSREIPASSLFTGFFSTALADGELIVDVTVPAHRPGAGSAFVEFAPRHGDFAVAGVAASVVRDGSGRFREAHAAACGVAATPVDLSDALAPLIGATAFDDGLEAEVAAGVARMVEPLGDVHATAEDRAELVRLLTVRALRVASERAADSRRR